MAFMSQSPADAARRAGLRRMRIVATSLLGVAFLVFVLTNGQATGWLGYVHTEIGRASCRERV